jgi:hypothetical protein
MTIRTLALTALLVTSTAGSTLAQTPAPPPPAPAARTPPPAAPAAPATATPAPARSRREGQQINIKVEFTITDQRGSATPTKRTLSLIVADDFTGAIRTQSSVARMNDVPLNVDASPVLLSDGKIRLGFNLQYDWPAPIEPGKDIPPGSVTRTGVHDSLSLILESGKSIVAAQSADPIGDRQVTVEVKATVLK